MEKQKRHTGQDSQLNARLEDYSALTRISAAAQKLRSRTGNWPLYAAAAGSALAMATSASASIIYYGPSNNYGHSATNPSLPPLHFTFDAGFSGNLLLDPPGDRVAIKVSAGDTFGSVQIGGNPPVHIFVSEANTQFARRFLANSAISAGPVQGDARLARLTSASHVFGNFPIGEVGFAGLSISNIGGNPSQKDYGWIRLSVLSVNGFPDRINIIDWAFESVPGAPIQAGLEIGGAPEPGTMAMALLASGAVGVAALRRRRKGLSR